MVFDCTEFCKALADDTRQQILQLLMEQDLCVSEITEAFSMSQPTISHHLSILRRAGLVTARRDGKQVFYGINQENVVGCCGKLMSRFVVESAGQDE